MVKPLFHKRRRFFRQLPCADHLGLALVLAYGWIVAKRNTSPDDFQTNQRPAAQTPKKGRPTPTRKQAEAARKNPLVASDRKAAKQYDKQKRNEAYQREQLALKTGDERFYPERDRGRVRRFIRDSVDARWSFSEFLLPIMVVFLLATLFMSWFFPNLGKGSPLILAFTIGLYSFFVLSIFEGIFTWNSIRKKIIARYPNDPIPKGSWFYCFARMIMIRRWRSPRPQVPRGQAPSVSDQTRR